MKQCSCCFKAGGKKEQREKWDKFFLIYCFKSKVVGEAVMKSQKGQVASPQEEATCWEIIATGDLAGQGESILQLSFLKVTGRNTLTNGHKSAYFK